MPQDIVSQFRRNYTAPIEEGRQVADINARDAISQSRRWLGMLVYVLSDQETYILRTGTSNNDWELLTSVINVGVIDNLTSTSTSSALSANQGRILNDRLTPIEGNYVDLTTNQSAAGEKTWTGALAVFSGRIGAGGIVPFGPGRLGDSNLQSASFDTQSVNFKDSSQGTLTAIFSNPTGTQLSVKSFNDSIQVLATTGLAADETSSTREVESTNALLNEYSDGSQTIFDMFNQDYPSGTSLEVRQAQGHVAIHVNGATAKKIGMWRYDGTTYTKLYEFGATDNRFDIAPVVRLEDLAGNGAGFVAVDNDGQLSWSAGSGGGGTFIGLTDTPANYTSSANKLLEVNSAGNAVEFSAITYDNTSLIIPEAGTGTKILKLGTGRSGDGTTYMDLIGDATYTDYGLRIIRQGGANAESRIIHRGTGNLVLRTLDAGGISFLTSDTERLNISSGGNFNFKASNDGADAILQDLIVDNATNTNADKRVAFLRARNDEGATGTRGAYWRFTVRRPDTAAAFDNPLDVHYDKIQVQGNANLELASGSDIIFTSTSNQGILHSLDNERVLIGGGSAWSGSNGAYIEIQGIDFGGVGAGGDINFQIPSAGRLYSSQEIYSEREIQANGGFRSAVRATTNANNWDTEDFSYLSYNTWTSSNTTGSTNFPTQAGQTLWLKGAGDDRSFAFYKETGFTANQNGFYLGVLNSSSVWSWHRISNAGMSPNYGTNTVTAGNFILSSDQRLKQDIKSYQPKRIDIPWRTFTWKDPDRGTRRQLGVIAQELQELAPEYVIENEGNLGVAYTELLIAKIAELEHRINTLENGRT